MMPGLDGLQVCQPGQGISDGTIFYIILLTARDRSEEIVGRAVCRRERLHQQTV